MSDGVNPDADLEGAFNSLNGGTAATIRNNVGNAVNDNPDQAAQYQHLARFTNTPVQTVQNDPTQIKQQAASQAVDADSITQNSPHTANLLSDPAKAAISHDDIDNLVASENAAKALPAPPGELSHTLQRTGRDVVSGIGMLGAPVDMIARLEYTLAQQVGLADKGTSADEMEQRMGVGGLTSRINDLLFPGGAPQNKLESNVDTAAQMIPATLETGGGTLPQAAWRSLYMGAAGIFGGEAQQNVNDWAKKTFPDMPFVTEALSQAANLGTMMATGLGGHVAEGTAGAVADTVRDKMSKVGNAQQLAESLTNLNDIAAASKVRERDTDTFSKFMSAASQDAPVKDLYIKAETFAQAAGDKLPAILEQLPQVKEQLNSALQTGGDIRMPVEDFASKIAGSDMAPGLIPHLKTEPDGFSQLEAESFMQTQGESLKAEVQKVLSEKEGNDAFNTSKQNVQDAVEAQLKEANRFTPAVNKQYSSLVSNFYATQAARIGITPEEMQARYPLNIAAQDLGEGFNQVKPLEDFPLAGAKVDGRDVGEKVYNTSSIGSSIDDYEVQKGIREVPFSSFDQMGDLKYYSKNTEARTKDLAEQIKQSGRIDPLIVAMDKEGPYILEGAHRFDALRELGAKSFPAMVVHDLESLHDGGLLKQNNLGSFNPATSTLGLMNGANLSTFLHESGHFFLDTLSRLAAHDEAPPEIKEDFAKLMNWFGGKDVNEWSGKSLEEQRPFHEQFARAFENYLMEGKAPSMELQPVFQRFRGWLLNVYRSAKDFLAQNPEAGKLDDETRGVMDRMLATSKDIKTAENARSIAPIFKTAEDAKMTPDEFQQYREQDIRGAQDAVTELDTRRLRDMQWLDNAKTEAIKNLQAEAKSKRDTIRDSVSKEVMREPVYAAERYIRRGEGPDGETALGNTKLNSADMKALGYPDEFIQKMSQGGKYGLTSAKGVHPDALAEQLGFSSGHELIDSLDKMEPAREKIAALTDQRMLEQHGDLTDPRAISRAADKAVYNEARNRIVATELKALNKQLGNKQILTQAAKQFAAEMVNKENASRLNPNLYMSNAARLGREAEEAFQAGKLQDAALAKRNQLINQYAVKAAFEAQKQIRDVMTQARKLDNTAYREKIPGQYLEQIDSLLGRYDLRTNPKKMFDQTRGEVNLFNWVKAQRDAGFEPAVADWLTVDPRGNISYKDMSVEEIKGLGDAVKSMLHMAREANKVTIAGKQLALDAVVKELSAPLIERGETFSKEELLNPPQKGTDSFLKVALYKMGSALRLSVSDLKPQEFKRNAYDLHDLQGPFGKYLFEPMFERNYWKLDRLRENSDFFKSWGEKLGTEWQKSLYNLVTNRTLLDPDLSSAGKPVYMKMTRAKLLAMMAHVGNESNFDKLSRGYEWNGADVMKFIHENATKEDWDAVQAQGKIFEKYWPEIEAMSRRLGGVPPSKIELRPVETRFGKYDGWYAPIDYDPIRSKLSAKYGDVMADPTEQIGGEKNYRATTTFNGSMQNRQAGYTDRVNLDYHGFESRLKETVHDLAYREQLIDANKILSDKNFRSQFTQTFGREEFNGLGNWLRGIRDMNVRDPANRSFDNFMQYSRQGIVMTGIAYRLSTVLKHGSAAALKSLGYLGDGPGMKYFSSRIARMATGNAMADIAAARDKFPEIRTRLMQMDRDYKEGSASMYKAEDWRAKNDRYGHAMVAWSDALTAVPTAWAAYDRAVNEGIPEAQGGTGKPMSEAQAVSYANKIVREAHGTALEAARSNFLQAKGVKGLFGTIYGFMNNTFGQLADIKDKATAENSSFTSNPLIAARLTATLIIPAVMAQWIGGSAKNDPWYEWGAKAITGELAGTVPFVRDAWSMIEYAKGEADTVGPLRIVQDVVNSVRDAYGETQGKSTQILSDVANAIGELAHVGGAGQAGKSLQYLRDVHTGKQQPHGAVDVIKGVTVGPPPKK